MTFIGIIRRVEFSLVARFFLAQQLLKFILLLGFNTTSLVMLLHKFFKLADQLCEFHSCPSSNSSYAEVSIDVSQSTAIRQRKLFQFHPRRGSLPARLRPRDRHVIP